jgi:Guanylylate cyclase
MEVVFCTITLGANPAFSSEAFYAENMPEDEARVQQLFNVREHELDSWLAVHKKLMMQHLLCVNICMSASVQLV